MTRLGLSPWRLCSAPCWDPGTDGTVPPYTSGTVRCCSSVRGTSLGAASAVRCFGLRGVTDGTRAQSSAGRLTCGEERPGAVHRDAGSRAEPRPVPGTAARGCPQLPCPLPVLHALPSCAAEGSAGKTLVP